MKQNTDSRIQKAKEITKEQLVNKIKADNPIRFDQMLIESEERKTYYFVKYNSVSYKRTPFILKFPIYKELSKEFDDSFLSSGHDDVPIKVEKSQLIEKLIQRGKTPILNSRYSSKNLVFSELKLDVNGDKPAQKQSFYFIPAETESCTCDNCDGDKYVTCPESECNGQHIYDCNKCGATGEIECGKCNGHGEYNCKKCNGGWVKCSSCSGKGEVTCGPCGGKGSRHDGSRCTTCAGRGFQPCGKCARKGEIKCSNCNNGIIKCVECKSRGRITCTKCSGKRQITCTTCYGDHKDNRYGKVDCSTCETMGEIGTISYIETEIENYNNEFLSVDGAKIDAPNFSVSSLKKHANANGQVIQTYFNLNGNNKDNYDEYSKKCSTDGLNNACFSKERYPKVIIEEMYYEGIPCATFNYNHILSATFHDVSVLAIDKEQEVLFHSDPTSVAEEKESLKVKVNELCRRAFSTKAFKDKIDRKHEMFLMVHMAKADGIIEEQEKRYLAQTITGLHGFTNKEKAELFGLMSSSTLPAISPLNAYFSSKERAEEARKKIVELVAKADGEYEPQEKLKLEEINNAIEAGYKAKPSAIGQFFKTWQVSISILLLVCVLVVSAYFLVFVYPQMKAERIAKHEALMKELDASLNITETNQSPNSTEAVINTDNKQAMDVNQETEELPVNSNDQQILVGNLTNALKGEWIGDFGGKELLISLNDVDLGLEITGYDEVKGNRRDLKGDITDNGNNIFTINLKEPGDDKWDGAFNIKYTDGENTMTGIWTANNGKSKKEFKLTKK